MSIRILIADDHGLIRAGLKALLENNLEMDVVGEAQDGHTVMRKIEELHPDLVIMDISMPGLNGIEATRRICQLSPNTRILALTVHEDESMLREMISAGAHGYLIKRAVESDLINAIQVVMQGHIYIYPAMTRALLKDISPHAVSNLMNNVTLTNREVDVLRLLARGYTNRAIAEELSLSPRTVEGHRSNLVKKLGISSRVELINYAEEHGFLNLTSPQKP